MSNEELAMLIWALNDARSFEQVEAILRDAFKKQGVVIPPRLMRREPVSA